MKKGCYILSDDNFSIDSSNGNGIHQKIMSQIKTFNQDGFRCDYLNLPQPRGSYVKKLFTILFSATLYSNITIKEYDFLYIRRIVPLTNNFIIFLNRYKNTYPSAKIIYELPTYPYDKEHSSFYSRIYLLAEVFFRKRIKKYVDLITTYSAHESVFGTPALQILNGVDCSLIPVSKLNKKPDNSLRLIAVAQFAKWHGYDRLIEGLNNYSVNVEKPRKIYFDIVGDGVELNNYKKLVQKYSMEDKVIFHGRKTGDVLTEVFDQADAGICSLGAHRKNMYLSSELKSREYLARGIPIVSSVKNDVIPEGFPFCLYFPEDDSPIDIPLLINYLDNLRSSYTLSEITTSIREFAEKNCDMSQTLNGVKNYILG